MGCGNVLSDLIVVLASSWILRSLFSSSMVLTFTSSCTTRDLRAAIWCVCSFCSCSIFLMLASLLRSCFSLALSFFASSSRVERELACGAASGVVWMASSKVERWLTWGAALGIVSKIGSLQVVLLWIGMSGSMFLCFPRCLVFVDTGFAGAGLLAVVFLGFFFCGGSFTYNPI